MNKIAIYIILTILSISTVSAITCVYEFYGEGCPHCEEVEPFLKDLESQGMEIHYYETWKNKNNANLLQDYFSKYNVPSNKRGVPIVFVGPNYYVGENEIKFGLEKELERSYSCPIINSPNKPDENIKKENNTFLILINTAALILILFLLRYLYRLYR